MFFPRVRGYPISSVIVAPLNASPANKRRADIVCDGKHDEQALLQSLLETRRYGVQIDASPAGKRSVECYGRHSVLWLPGDYTLDATLTIPDMADSVISAEGTYFHYRPTEGDAVKLRGMMRCRYMFGTIESHSTGAAIKVKPSGADDWRAGIQNSAMATQMSKVSFMGLIGHDQKGVGLDVDQTCTNAYEGTDISGFDVGVQVASAGAGKIDTNWFWFSYIRMCNTCIIERGGHVDDNVWYVNVDASIPGATCIRTAAIYGSWYVIIGMNPNYRQNRGIILDPGARHNVFEVHPPLDGYPWEDNSGNDTNVILTTQRAPLMGT
jgi:hypothetical protein